MLDARRTRLLDRRATALERDGGAPNRLDRLVRRRSDAVVGVKGDPQALDVHRCRIAQRHRHDPGVDVVGSGDDRQQQNQVVDVAGHRSDDLKRVLHAAERIDVPGTWHSPEAGLDSGGAAEVRW